MILAEVNTHLLTSWRDVYLELKNLCRDKFEDHDRILIRYSSNNQKTLDEIIDYLDIPRFFIQFELMPSSILKSFSNHHCVYPWINLLVETDGTVKPCCIYQKSTGLDIRNGIESSYFSKPITDLRQEFLDGKQPTACRQCWQKESVGIASMRQLAKDKFKDIYYLIDYVTPNINDLQVFDLKLGNHCNLGCKICDEQSSSTIAREKLEQGLLSKSQFNIIQEKTKWCEDETFWDEMFEKIQNLKYLDLYGGEPLMTKAHFRFLEKLVARGVSQTISLDYNTNGTVYSEKFFDIWNNFKQVKLSFSIDDIEDRFEQQRRHASWLTVTDNIKKYNLKQSKNFTTEIFPTINSQNVFWLPELISWAETQKFNSISWGILEVPRHYSILSMSLDQTEKTIDKLGQFNWDITNKIKNLLVNNIANLDRHSTMDKV